MTMHRNAVNLFLSYAHEDEPLLKELVKHLSVLERQGLISTWYDRQIIPGTDWSQVIDEHLEQASIILLLISPDFLASDYYYQIEMQRALERHRADEARVIPIVMRPVDWKGAPFANLEALPTDAKAITIWRNRGQAFVDVVAGIRRAIEDLSLLPASVPHAVLPAIWAIPYPPNPFFIGHDDLLRRLHTQLQTGQATVLSQPQAISGLGGIGKTQIAVEYAYRYHQEYKAVLWARAESQEALNSSYYAIATLLHLSEREAKEQEITIQAVKRWLQTHREWLLILDNADELVTVKEFIPPAFQGHLLLTTRAQAMGGLARKLEVEVMQPEIGALLLLRRSGLIAPDAPIEQVSPADITVAKELSEKMGGLPLALDQAGAYIEEVSCSLQDYLRLFQVHQDELLKKRGGVVPDHPESVATTWSLSFRQVEEKNPAAADLLRLCVFLAPDAIPEEILTAGATSLGLVLAPVASDAFQMNQVIDSLRAYSLIRRDPWNKMLSVHRLVQAALRDTMTENIQYEWAERSVRAVQQAFPYANYTNWPQCERVLPHALACTSHIETYPLIFPEAALLLMLIGRYLAQRGQDTMALDLRALAIREQVLGPEHPDTATGLSNLAGIYYYQGKYTEAEPLEQRALTIYEKVFGNEHPRTTHSLSVVAHLYFRQGRYEEAEPLEQRALAIRERVLGPEHPDTATSLTNLVSIYASQGKYAEAEPLYQRALAIREQVLDPLHLDIVTSLNNLIELYGKQKKYEEAETFFQRTYAILAILYYNQGKYEEAKLLYERALDIREQVLGPEHPHTVATLGNLGGLYYNQGKYEEAEPLFQRALVIYEQAPGNEHPDTLTTLDHLAYIYYNQGKYEEAEPLYQRALTIQEQILGPQHSDTATCLNNLAYVYYSQGKYEEAEPLYQRALAIQEQMLGPQHPNTAASLNNLGELYYSQRKYQEAELLYQRALVIYEQVLGPQHPNTAISLNNLAHLYYNQGKYEEAEPLYQRALAIYEQARGTKHLDNLTSLDHLAYIYYNQGKYAEAEPLYERALDIRERVLGPQHLDTATTLSTLAGLYDNQGKYAEAEPLYQRALAIQEQMLGPQHLDTTTSLNNLAYVYYNQGKYEEAEPLYQRALAISEQVLGPDHSDAALILNNLGMLYLRQGRYEQAKPPLERALVIWRQVLGLEHSLTARIFDNLGTLYLKQDMYEEAEPLLHQGLAISERALGPEHPDIAARLSNLAGLYSNQGRYEEAAPLYQRALAIMEKSLGPNHPTIKATQENYIRLVEEMEGGGNK